MSKPQFHHLDSFSRKCISLKTNALTVSKEEAQYVAADYQKLLKYIVELQAELVAREQPTEVEIVGSSF